MSVALYDSALLEKIKYWVGDTGIKLIGNEDTKRLFETIADEKNDSPLKLPLITLSRVPTYSVNVKHSTPLTYSGGPVKFSEQKVVQLNAIPITLTYMINVYTRYLTQADEITRNLIFNIVNYPNVTIEIPYENLNLLHDQSIHLISEIEDNSNIPERVITGQFTRMTLTITVDDAYLFDVRVKDTKRLIVENINTD